MTKCHDYSTYRRKSYWELTVSEGKYMMIMSGRMTAGRHGTGTMVMSSYLDLEVRGNERAN